MPEKCVNVCILYVFVAYTIQTIVSDGFIAHGEMHAPMGTAQTLICFICVANVQG